MTDAASVNENVSSSSSLIAKYACLLSPTYKFQVVMGIDDELESNHITATSD